MLPDIIDNVALSQKVKRLIEIKTGSLEYFRKQYGQLKKYTDQFPNAEDRVLMVPKDLVGKLIEEKKKGATKLGKILDEGDWKIIGLPRKSEKYKEIVDNLVDFVYPF